jgi:hypothetical protein
MTSANIRSMATTPPFAIPLLAPASRLRRTTPASAGSNVFRAGLAQQTITGWSLARRRVASFRRVAPAFVGSDAFAERPLSPLQTIRPVA